MCRIIGRRNTLELIDRIFRTNTKPSIAKAGILINGKG